jgi:hypothetical protein
MKNHWFKTIFLKPLIDRMHFERHIRPNSDEIARLTASAVQAPP